MIREVEADRFGQLAHRESRAEHRLLAQHRARLAPEPGEPRRVEAHDE